MPRCTLRPKLRTWPAASSCSTAPAGLSLPLPTPNRRCARARGLGGESPELPSFATVLLRQLAELGKRAVVHASFIFTKQPLRIAQVLKQVYADPTNVDDELIESIRRPADDPNAAEVFFRIISSGGKTTVTVNQLVRDLRVPLLLLWGDKDPWIRPERAETIKALYAGPRVEHVKTLAGHCPHDDQPAIVNAALEGWLTSLTAAP